MTSKTTVPRSAMIVICSFLLLIGSVAADNSCEPCVVSQQELEQIQAHRQELHQAVGNLERDLGIEREASTKLNQANQEIVLSNERMMAELKTARQQSAACSPEKQQEAQVLQGKLKLEIDENHRLNSVLKETTEHRDRIIQDWQVMERSLEEEKGRHEANLRAAELSRQESLKEFELSRQESLKEFEGVKASLENQIVQIREEESHKQASLEKESADLASRLESRISEVVSQNEHLQTVVQTKTQEHETLKSKFYETRQELFQTNEKLREIENNRQIIAIDVPLFLEKVDELWTLVKEEASKVLADINEMVGPYLSQLKEALDTAYGMFMEVATPLYDTFSDNMRKTYVPTAVQMSHDARLKIIDISNDMQELAKPHLKQLQEAWEPHGKTISAAWEPYGSQVEGAYAPFRPMVNSSLKSAREFSAETFDLVGKNTKKYTKIFHLLMIVATQYVIQKLSVWFADAPKMIVEPLTWSRSNFILVAFCIEAILATMISLRLLAFIFRLFFPKPKTKQEMKKEQRKKRRDENKTKYKKA